MGVQESIIAGAFKWAKGQTFTNQLLAAILVFGGVFAWYGVPAHLQMLREWSDAKDKAHREERGEMMVMYDKWIQQVCSDRRGVKLPPPPGIDAHVSSDSNNDN